MSRWHAWKGMWRPSGCQQRGATEYTFPLSEEPADLTESFTAFVADNKPFRHRLSDRGTPWCAACMREAVEPFVFPCGHSFCRRCLLNVQQTLTTEFRDVIMDERARLRCPLGGCERASLCLPCRATQPLRPFVNGDFRFSEVRACDKVQLTTGSEEALTEEPSKCDHYVDTSARSSGLLFDEAPAWSTLSRV